MSHLIRFLLLSSLFGFAVASMGQQTVNREDAVLDQIRACNDGWVESIKRDDFAAFESVCPREPDAWFWYQNREAPVALGGADGLWTAQSPQMRDIAWENLELVRMRFVGDLALVYYTVTWIPEMVDAEPVRLRSRRFTVLHQVDGVWVQAGGTIMAPP